MLTRYSDRKIIEVLGGDEEKSTNKMLKHLYQQYFPMASAIVKQYGGSEDEIPDVFQEALIAFYENIRKKKFRGDSALNTYLYSTIKNIWFTRLKKLKRVVDLENTELANDQIIDLQIEDCKDEVSDLMKGIINNLGESCKNILRLYYYENCNMKELKDLMGFRNEDSAKSQKYKCMQKLIKYLNNKPELKKYLYELL